MRLVETSLDEADFLAMRKLSDGRFLYVDKMGYGQARLAITPLALPDSLAFADSWMYAHPDEALAAMVAWNPVREPEPPGWFRHVASGRRRPQGNPALEYVQE